MAKITAILVLVLLLVGCAAVMADDAKTPVALSYQLYFPSNSSTQDAFGDSWSGFGLDILRTQETKKWEFLIGANAISSSENNDASIWSITAGYQKNIAGTEKVQPFVVLRAGPYHGHVEVPSLGLDESKWGLNGNGTIGVLFNKRFVLQARYDCYSKIGGFSFNGLTLSAGLKIFEF